LDRVKAREGEAWERLADLYGPLVYGWCRQSGLQAEDAADVGQEVFGAVLTRVERFRRDRPGDTFRGWLWTITRNKIRDHFRRRSGRAQAPGGTGAQQQLAQIPDAPPDLSVTSPSSKVRGLLEHRAVEMVRAGVEDRTWRAFWLVTVEGRAPADVAQELGITAQAVYDAKYRVRRRIRHELGDLIE
jgi:RNA polymerase sigma-70 factor (ECF subfamily)